MELDSMLVRISEIDVHPEYLDEYMKEALTVGDNSVVNEPGVVCIYPMVQKRDGSKVRILEIYRDMDAYNHHISTPWFRKYKQGMIHMVKHLDLVDMFPMNPIAISAIFRKMWKIWNILHQAIQTSTCHVHVWVRCPCKRRAFMNRRHGKSSDMPVKKASISLTLLSVIKTV